MTPVSAALELALQRQLAAWRAGGVRPTISSIAASAGVSRQNVYKSHRAVVEKLLAETDPSKRLNTASTARMLEVARRALARERQRTRALASLCAELAAELLEARRDLDSELCRLRTQSARKMSSGDAGLRLVETPPEAS